MKCEECNSEIEQIDTTYSNFDSDRVRNRTHTGNIYECHKCEIMILENLITGSSERWIY